jgi:FtsX-like permease family
MFRLGLQLTLRSGREALVRLIVTATAVAVGVVIMLAVLADFHAFQVTNHKPFWEGTTAMQIVPGSASHVELWNYSNEVYQAQTIEVLDVAALGPHAPVPPGIRALPKAGQFYASPALAALLRSVPRDELGARFPGSQAGTIGHQALTGPTELVIIIGRTPAQLAGLPSTIRVDKIQTTAGKQIWSHYFRDAFVVGAIAFLVPILILVGTATRLASARREERYAALRLVGATPRQVNVIASADAAVSAGLGALAGIGIFALLVRPALAGTAITSARYFGADVTPTTWGYLAVLVGLPVFSALATFLSLRRVRISPLGVSRKVSPAVPGTWRIVPLLVGIALFVVGMLATNSKNIGAPAFPGLLVIMIGLVVGGPWLTERAARLLPRLGKGAASVLAARRLADNPKGAFRSVSGLVLAVFLGTVTAGLLPAVNATTATPSASALTNVLMAQFIASPICGNEVNCTGYTQPQGQGKAQQRIGMYGMPPADAARLLAGLGGFRGAHTVPIYSVPLNASGPNPNSYSGVVSCAGMQELKVLGTCAPGRTYVPASTFNLYGDNPTYTTQAFVSAANPQYRGRVASLYLQSVLVKVNSQATLERVRSYLVTHTPEIPSGSAPRTFGEAVQARVAVGATVQRLVDIAVALTLIVAGCSLAVVVGGGLVERKRAFTLMRVSGTPTSALYRVVLLEAVAPLAAATLVAAGTAYGISLLTVWKLAPAGTPLPVLGHVYYLTMAAGLAASLLVILAALPLLGRITGPATVRFE